MFTENRFPLAPDASIDKSEELKVAPGRIVNASLKAHPPVNRSTDELLVVKFRSSASKPNGPSEKMVATPEKPGGAVVFDTNVVLSKDQKMSCENTNAGLAINKAAAIRNFLTMTSFFTA